MNANNDDHLKWLDAQIADLEAEKGRVEAKVRSELEHLQKEIGAYQGAKASFLRRESQQGPVLPGLLTDKFDFRGMGINQGSKLLLRETRQFMSLQEIASALKEGNVATQDKEWEKRPWRVILKSVYDNKDFIKKNGKYGLREWESTKN